MKKVVEYRTIKHEHIGTDEVDFMVQINLPEISKEKLSIFEMDKSFDEIEEEEWYLSLYENIDKNKKKYGVMETGIESESDIYYMHLYTKTKEDGIKLKKYMTQYISRITDKNILAKFSKLSEKEKFKGATKKFYDEFFEEIHKNLKYAQNKTKNLKR